jgi:hypothetical protein
MSDIHRSASSASAGGRDIEPQGDREPPQQVAAPGIRIHRPEYPKLVRPVRSVSLAERRRQWRQTLATQATQTGGRSRRQRQMSAFLAVASPPG